MVSPTALWVPILVSSIIVFLASWVLHMLIPMHRKDFTKLPGEERIAAAIRAEKVPPGNYMMPHCEKPKDLGTPQMMEKFKQGPLLVMNVWPTGPMNMGKPLAQWFVYTLLVGLFCAYLAGLTLAPGTHYRVVFRIVSTTAFIGYGLHEIVSSIWKAQKWSTTFKHLIDGMIYALLTAGVFGWLWPEA